MAMNRIAEWAARRVGWSRRRASPPPDPAERLQRLAEGMRDRMPAVDLDDCIETATHGEPGVALENLSVQLVERGAAPTATERAEIRALAAAMGMEREIARILRD